MVYRGTIRCRVVAPPADVTLSEGTEVLVALPDQPESSAAGAAIWGRLTELGRWSETLPSDLPSGLAANHGHHFHGLPKRHGRLPVDRTNDRSVPAAS